MVWWAEVTGAYSQCNPKRIAGLPDSFSTMLFQNRPGQITQAVIGSSSILKLSCKILPYENKICGISKPGGGEVCNSPKLFNKQLAPPIFHHTCLQVCYMECCAWGRCHYITTSMVCFHSLMLGNASNSIEHSL